MADSCTQCGVPLPENASHCPACGAAQSVGGGAAAVPAYVSLPISENLAALLAYVTVIPAIIFLLLQPYNRNRFVRFHAFQSLFFFVVVAVIGVVMPFLAAIPFLGVLVWALVAIAAGLLWLLLVIKAYSGEMWKLPVIGDLAEQQANA